MKSVRGLDISLFGSNIAVSWPFKWSSLTLCTVWVGSIMKPLLSYLLFLSSFEVIYILRFTELGRE